MGFGRLIDFAERRPLHIAAVGLGLAAEAGRVLWGLNHDTGVVVFGHDGGTNWSVAEDTLALQAYVVWITVCALVLVVLPAGFALKRRAQRKRAEAVARSRGTSVVVRTRDHVELKRS
jgi:hypothetical protein